MKSKKSPHACHEVEIHYKRPLFDEMPKVKSQEDSSRILKSFCNPKQLDHKEYFWVMLLTNANCLLGISNTSCGTIKSTIISIVEILQLAINTNASAIIVAHNHPSGKLIPSQKDIQLTNKIKEACELFDIKLLDHLIITSESYLSFADEGLV